MSTARQPLIGDILHIRGEGFDLNVRISNIVDNKLIIADMNNDIKMLIWDGRNWVLTNENGTSPRSVHMELIDRQGSLPYIASRMRDPRELTTNIVNRRYKQENPLIDQVETLDRQTMAEFKLNRDKSNKEIPIEIQETMYRQRAMHQKRQEQSDASRVGKISLPQAIWGPNPYQSRMAQAMQTAYPENRPGMSNYTVPNSDPKKFRLPKPKL